MDVFFLAIALLCQNQKTLKTLEVLHTKPISHAECLARESDKALRERILNPADDDCEEILICIEAGWQTE